MYKILMAIAFTTISLSCFSQDTLSVAEKKALDSMLAEDEFLKMLKEPYSYFDISLTAGNGFFSSTSNNLNAVQTESQKLFFTPAVAYYHKSGLGVSLSGYVASDSGKMKLYQYLINPFWEFKNKDVSGSLSYTRTIPGSSTTFDASPFRNDLYGNIELRKPWIQPGLALGYSGGTSKEVFDTTIRRFDTVRNRFVTINVTDNITTKLKAFTASFSLAHSFEYEKIFSEDDGLLIKPSIMANASSIKYTVTHSANLSRMPLLQRKLTNRYGNGTTSDKFQLQSVAFQLETMYSVGKFYLQPQVYLDYFLPETTSKRLTTVFSVTAGISLF